MTEITKEQVVLLDKLATTIAPYKAKNLTDILVREVEEEDYLNQDNFKESLTPCLDRGVAILKEAGIEVTPDKAVMMQYVIAYHRNKTHDEDTAAELKMSTSIMTTDQEVALTAFGWWGG